MVADVTAVLCELELTITKVKVSTTPDGKVMDLFFIIDNRFFIISTETSLSFYLSLLIYLLLNLGSIITENFYIQKGEKMIRSNWFKMFWRILSLLLTLNWLDQKSLLVHRYLHSFRLQSQMTIIIWNCLIQFEVEHSGQIMFLSRWTTCLVRLIPLFKLCAKTTKAFFMTSWELLKITTWRYVNVKSR
jgi:hypothetical protein